MTREEIAGLFDLPFFELLHRAHEVHHRAFPQGEIQLATLISIKTGACPEDCSYCAQSARYDTKLPAQAMMDPCAVVEAAKKAVAAGATRFCMGAAGRAPSTKDLAAAEAMVRGVKALGLETCLTLGMLSSDQARSLKDAGLDFYNHNLDTSREYYGEIVTTRTYEDRLGTLAAVREAGIKVCSGGILGMGESRADRVGLVWELHRLSEAPESVSINRLIPMKGTPLAETGALDDFEFVRMIAVARIVFEHSQVRLSAGRESMDDALQALCFYAGANSIFHGERLLTAGNADALRDAELLRRLDLRVAEPHACAKLAEA